MHNIKDLKIWNKGIDLALKVYDIMAKFPADEGFGLISQTRRYAVLYYQIFWKVPEETQIKHLYNS